ncbi:MAG: hypothetical protein INR73_29270 [Williamsia sp.]|nr:hypothetical protein [Williamsia sp.]
MSLLTYRNNPILQKLHDGKLGQIGYYLQDADFFNTPGQAVQIGDAFKAKLPYFKRKIRLLSQPFQEAMWRAQKLLTEAGMMDRLPSDCGTLVMGETTYLYQLENGPDFYACDVWEFYKDRLVSMVAERWTPKTGQEMQAWRSKALLTKESLAMVDNNHTLWAGQAVGNVFLFIQFLKHCPIQTKELTARKKARLYDCKYVNQTDLTIQVLNSTWFTNLVKSEGFNVRGHFRWQRHGPNNSLLKLIWINEFEKSGYTMAAKATTNGTL